MNHDLKVKSNPASNGPFQYFVLAKVRWLHYLNHNVFYEIFSNDAADVLKLL